MIRAFAVASVPRPKDFRSLSAFAAEPLDIEIGCGVGFHPLQYARANPSRTLIAFERTKEKFAKFAGRVAHHDALPNLVAVHGDGIAWVVHGVRPTSVDRYFLLYPNPSPKDKNQRWFAMPFMRHMISTLKVGGTITLATNITPYYEEAKELATEEWGLKIVEDRAVAASDKPRTHFEKKYLERGETCWNLVVKKN